VRYRLLETIREYASELLRESQDAPELQRRHAEYFSGFAQRDLVLRRGMRQPRNLDLLRHEYDNMRAALHTFLSIGDLRAGLALCQVLIGFWLTHGYFDDGEVWVRRFLEHENSAGLDWEDRAQGFIALARSAEYRGRFELARSYFEQTVVRAGRRVLP
jgi:predicted ATPase